VAKPLVNALTDTPKRFVHMFSIRKGRLLIMSVTSPAVWFISSFRTITSWNQPVVPFYVSWATRKQFANFFICCIFWALRGWSWAWFAISTFLETSFFDSKIVANWPILSTILLLLEFSDYSGNTAKLFEGYPSSYHPLPLPFPPPPKKIATLLSTQ